MNDLVGITHNGSVLTVMAMVIMRPELWEIVVQVIVELQIKVLSKAAPIAIRMMGISRTYFPTEDSQWLDSDNDGWGDNQTAGATS